MSYGWGIFSAEEEVRPSEIVDHAAGQARQQAATSSRIAPTSGATTSDPMQPSTVARLAEISPVGLLQDKNGLL